MNIGEGKEKQSKIKKRGRQTKEALNYRDKLRVDGGKGGVGGGGLHG